ncbi:LPS assembly lipoprotein LptE [Arenimonas caeni]|jgi:LPS-assembly lipoprotein|uniref:LPS-assembly lipoprotein LptE n=1 Tax=Arenimonas caeni TaxID=2058085 RepID=UPI002A36D6FE|nr:LPS assembly lipoprotein LptE [Arenimonas caeni]MDY0021873.1 LPS assembly lipoprotein LptE [Arenimonas caeni]
MRNLLIVLCLSLLAAGCGFKPRASLAVATELGPVAVSASDRFSPLARDLAAALTRAGAEPAVEGEPASTLKLLRERRSSRPLTYERGAGVREYEITYEVEFELRAADGSVRVPRQRVELSRDYTYDARGAIGSPAEERLLDEELRRGMVAAVMRRLDAALRAD